MFAVEDQKADTIARLLVEHVVARQRVHFPFTSSPRDVQAVGND